MPGTGIRINQHDIEWGMSRESVRQRLGMPHKVDDYVFELKKYFPNEDKPPIETWRDIYKNWRGEDNYFFLYYDRDQRLTQLELHWGMPIRIGTVVLNFGEPLDSAVKQLAETGIAHRAIEEGLLFEREKFTLSDGAMIGSDREGLAYFYAAADVSHILNDL